MMNKVLVTGASGFIGSRLVRALEKKRVTVRVLSRVKQENLETVICDFESDPIPDETLNGVDTVFHLAGLAHDKRNTSIVKSLYQKINVDASVQLAELAVLKRVKHFIFVSSVKAGGSPLTGESMTELDQGELEGVYGKTKREAELKLLELGKKSVMKVTIIRPSLVYGPDVKGNLQLMINGIQKGWFPPLPEFQNRRSMVHVDDLVKAILLVVKARSTSNEIFIVTDGIAYSSRDIYEIMCRLSGRVIPKWHIPMFFFHLLAFISLIFRYKVHKLFEDEYYSAKKIKSIGFLPDRSLKEMNETSF